MFQHTAAFPPCCRTLIPAREANGSVLETIPLVLCTTLLLLPNLMKSGLVPWKALEKAEISWAGIEVSVCPVRVASWVSR